MRKLFLIILMLGFLTPTLYAQTLTTSDVKYVKAIRLIKDLKKQIEEKRIEKTDAVDVVRVQCDVSISTTRAQYKAELDALKDQLKTAAQSIGLKLKDVE